MNVWTMSGVAAIVLWIVVAFVIAWPSGLAHIPLAAGVVLIARGIVLHGVDAPPD